MSAVNALKEIVKTFNIKAIPFDPEWDNGTGYFDGIVRDELGLAPGEAAHFIDDADRLAVVVGTRFGNVVVFTRYQGGGRDAVVSNIPRELKGWLPGSAWNADQINFNLSVGLASQNVGARLELLADHILDPVTFGDCYYCGKEECETMMRADPVAPEEGEHPCCRSCNRKFKAIIHNAPGSSLAGVNE